MNSSEAVSPLCDNLQKRSNKAFSSFYPGASLPRLKPGVQTIVSKAHTLVTRDQEGIDGLEDGFRETPSARQMEQALQRLEQGSRGISLQESSQQFSLLSSRNCFQLSG